MRTSAILTTATGAVLLLSLTACGGSTSAAPSSDTTVAVPAASPAATGGTTGQPDMTAFRDCMAENGVTLPEPGQAPPGGAAPSGVAIVPAPSTLPSGAPPSGAPGGPGMMPLPAGIDQATLDAALKECGSRPAAGGPAGGSATIDDSAVAAFRSCLTDHGVTVPSGDGWMTQLDRSDPTVTSALDTCSALLPRPAASQ